MPSRDVACGPDSVSGLRDRFDDEDISPDWTVFESGSLSIREEDGELNLRTWDLASNQYSAIATVDDYKMKDCAVFVKLASLYDFAAKAYAHFTVRNATDDKLEFGVSTENLELKVFEAGRVVWNIRLQLDRTAHRYLQLREADSVTYWEASTDARTWNVLDTHPTSIPLDAVKVMFGGGTYGPLMEPLTVASFDDLNVAP